MKTVIWMIIAYCLGCFHTKYGSVSGFIASRLRSRIESKLQYDENDGFTKE